MSEAVQPELRARAGALVAPVYAVATAAAVVLTVVMLTADVGDVAIGVLMVALLILLMLMSVPIGIAMIVCSVVAILGMVDLEAADSSLATIAHGAVSSWSLSVVPLFVLMGIIIWRGGIADAAYEVMRQWFGGLPGGIAVASNLGGAAMAAGSGSSVAVTYSLGRIALPQMLRTGYQPGLATGTVAMAGTLGQIIPPSVLLVIYAGVAETSVGQQLAAGIVPGLLVAAAFAGLIVLRSTVNRGLAPRPDLGDVTWRTRRRSLGGLLPLLVVIGTVLGGLLFGVFTATESAAFGVIAAVVATLVPLGERRTRIRDLPKLLRDSVVEAVPAVAGIMLVLVGSYFLTRALALSGLTAEIAGALTALDLGRVEFLLLLMVMYVVVGTFLDSLPTILLTVPLLAAPLAGLGVDMIWFGVFIILLVEIGMVTPPVGMLLFVVHRLAQDPDVNQGRAVSLATVFRGTLPFIATMLVLLVIFVLAPDIVTWLPGLLR